METEHFLYKNHVTNEEIRSKIKAATEEYVEILPLVKKRKFKISKVQKNRN